MGLTMCRICYCNGERIHTNGPTRLSQVIIQPAQVGQHLDPVYGIRIDPCDPFVERIGPGKTFIGSACFPQRSSVLIAIAIDGILPGCAFRFLYLCLNCKHHANILFGLVEGVDGAVPNDQFLPNILGPHAQRDQDQEEEHRPTHYSFSSWRN